MKLHLPKALLSAVIAAAGVVSTQAFAEDYTVSTDQTWSALLGDTATTANDTITVSDGATFTIDTGTTSHALGTLTVDGATVDVTYGNGNTAAAFITGSTINMTNGSKMILRRLDAAGWGHSTWGNPFSLMSLQDSTLELGARQTWGANIELKGNASITPMAGTTVGADTNDPCLDLYGRTNSALTITVSGLNNTIDTAIRITQNATINNSGALSLRSRIYNNGSNTLTINTNNGGSLTIDGNVEQGAKVVVHEASGSTVFGGGTGTRAYIERLELGDSASASTLTIMSGYTVAIKGNNNGNNAAGGYKTASLLIGEWNHTTDVSISGNLYAQNACLTTGDQGGNVTIEDGGVLAVKGIMRANTAKNAKMDLTLKDGGKLILGASGVTFEGTGSKVFDLQGGTLGISDDSTVNVALAINGNVTADTTKYVFSDAGGTLTRGEDGGDLLLKGNLSGTGTLTAIGAGTLSLGAISSSANIDASAATLGFAGTLTLGEGSNLTLGSSIAVNMSVISNFASSQVTYVTTGGERSEEAHGFAEGAFTLVSGGTITGSASYTVGTDTFTLDNDHRSFSVAGENSHQTYFMNWGSEDTLSSIQAASQGSLQTINMSGGTLTVDSALADNQNIEVHGASTVSIAAGSTLGATQIDIQSGSLTLLGAGTFENGSSIDRPANVTLDASWTGTVVVRNFVFGDPALEKGSAKLRDQLSNSNSFVGLVGCSGWLTPNAVLAANLNLMDGENPAIKLTDGSPGNPGSPKSMELSGRIVGSGDFEVNMAGKTKHDIAYVFSGDVSGWDGTFRTVAPTGQSGYEVRFTGTGNVAASIENGANFTLGVTLAGDSARTMSGTISGNGTTNLTTSGAGAKTFTKAVSVASATLNGGAVTFNNNLTLTDNATFGTNVEMTKGDGLSLANGKSITISAGKTFTHDGFTYKAGDSAPGIINKVSDSNTDKWSTNTDIISTYYSAGTTVSDLTLTKTVNDTKTVRYLLNNVNFVNKLATTTLTHDGNQLSGLTVEAGTVNVNGNTTVGTAESAAAINIGANATLTIADGKTLTNYTTVGAEDSAATVTITNLGNGAATVTNGGAAAGKLSVETEGMNFSNSKVEIDTAGTFTSAATLENSKLVVVGGGSVATNVKENSTNDFDATAGNITVNSAVASVGTLDIGAGKTVTVGSGTGTATVSGTATIAEEGTFNGGLTITSTGSLVLSGTANVNGTLTFENNATLNLTGLNITAKDTQETYTLVAGLDSIVKDGTLVLEGFDVGDRAWSLQTTDGTVLMSGGTEGQVVSIQMFSLGSESLQMIVAGSTPSLTVTEVTGAASFEGGVLTLTTNANPAGDVLTGPVNLTVGSAAWDQILGLVGDPHQYVTIAFADFDTNGNTVTLNGYAGEANGTHFVAFIPEPTTGALSVLALAALVMRRRRKAA